MKKIKIDNDLYQYQFPPFEGQQFGFNIHVLIDKKRALLIDTAFEQHAQMVVEDLHKEGITIDEVVFSHFHPDHISGISALSSPKLYGNGLYQATLDKFTPIEKHHYFNEMNIVDESSVLKFGAFTLQFKLIQGHVPCGMFTIINDTFVQVADDVMASNDGLPLLPSVHIDNVKGHITSLDLLKDYASCTLLLSHGNAIRGSALVLDEIEQRQRYLRALVANKQPITVEQATKDCDCEFLLQEWHNYVYS